MSMDSETRIAIDKLDASIRGALREHGEERAAALSRMEDRLRGEFTASEQRGANRLLDIDKRVSRIEGIANEAKRQSQASVHELEGIAQGLQSHLAGADLVRAEASRHHAERFERIEQANAASTSEMRGRLHAQDEALAHISQSITIGNHSQKEAAQQSKNSLAIYATIIIAMITLIDHIVVPLVNHWATLR